MESNSTILTNGSLYHFSPIYPRDNILVMVGLSSVAVFTSVTFAPVTAAIIQCERNHQNRTLINQLLSSVFWCILFFSILMFPMAVVIYNYGPLESPILCRIPQTLGSAIVLQGILLSDAIVIVKIVFIFFLKNPTAIQDDFWKVFINMWIFLLNATMLFIYQNLPGKEQMGLSICIGKIPIRDMNTNPPKMPFHFIFVNSLTVVLNFGLWMSKFLYRKFFRKRFSEYEKREQHLANLVSKDNLYVFAVHIVGLIIVISDTYFLRYRVNRMHPMEIQEYPNSYYLLVQDLVVNPCCLASLVLLYLLGHSKLRKDVTQEIRSKFLYCLAMLQR